MHKHHVHPPVFYDRSFNGLKFQILLDAGSTDKHIKVLIFSVFFCHLLVFVDKETKSPLDIASCILSAYLSKIENSSAL